MNINWMKIGCVSVAEYGRFTLVIRFRSAENETWLEIRETSSGTLKHSASTTRGEEKAISECELWLEQIYKGVGGMKLDWKTEGTASICYCNRITCVVHFAGDGYSCSVCRSAIPAGNGLVVEGTSGLRTMASAWAWCEREVEKHDHPEWHDVTDWLSWAEWRGWRMCVRPDSVDPSITQWSASKNGYRGEFLSITGPDFPRAKAAAEKWVREQRV